MARQYSTPVRRLLRGAKPRQVKDTSHDVLPAKVVSTSGSGRFVKAQVPGRVDARTGEEAPVGPIAVAGTPAAVGDTVLVGNVEGNPWGGTVAIGGPHAGVEPSTGPATREPITAAPLWPCSRGTLGGGYFSSAAGGEVPVGTLVDLVAPADASELPTVAHFAILVVDFGGRPALGLAFPVDDGAGGEDLRVELRAVGDPPGSSASAEAFWSTTITVGTTMSSSGAARSGAVMQHDAATKSFLVHPPGSSSIYRIAVADGSVVSSAGTGFSWCDGGWKACRGFVVGYDGATVRSFRVEATKDAAAWSQAWSSTARALTKIPAAIRMFPGPSSSLGIPVDVARGRFVIYAVSWEFLPYDLNPSLEDTDQIERTTLHLAWVDGATGEVTGRYEWAVRGKDWVRVYGASEAKAYHTDTIGAIYSAGGAIQNDPSAGSAYTFNPGHRNYAYPLYAPGFLTAVSGFNQYRVDPVLGTAGDQFPDLDSFANLSGSAGTPYVSWTVGDMAFDESGNLFVVAEHPINQWHGIAPVPIWFDDGSSVGTVATWWGGVSRGLPGGESRAVLLGFDSDGKRLFGTEITSLVSQPYTLLGAGYEYDLPNDATLAYRLRLTRDYVVLLRQELTDLASPSTSYKTIVEAYTKTGSRVYRDEVLLASGSGTSSGNLGRFAAGGAGPGSGTDWICAESDAGASRKVFLAGSGDVVLSTAHAASPYPELVAVHAGLVIYPAQVGGRYRVRAVT